MASLDINAKCSEMGVCKIVFGFSKGSRENPEDRMANMEIQLEPDTYHEETEDCHEDHEVMHIQ